MLSATQGVNTHKGALFSLGILCAAAGRVLGQDGSISTSTLSDTTAQISSGIIERELMPLLEGKGCKTRTKKLSAGEILYLRHGFCGIRGEVASGVKIVTERRLPVLEEKLRKGINLNDALVDTFLSILTVSEDSNIVWRSGLEGLDYSRVTITSLDSREPAVTILPIFKGQTLRSVQCLESLFLILSTISEASGEVRKS